MSAGISLLQWVKQRRSTRGVGRWARAFFWGIWKMLRLLPGSTRWKIPLHTTDGLRMKVRCFSYEDLLVVSPDYEAPVAQELPPCGGIAVDAGAFLGLYTLRYARAVGPTGKVLAFEPHPENFRLLTENIQGHRGGQVLCFPAALGVQSGWTSLIWEKEGESSTARMDPARVLESPRPLPSPWEYAFGGGKHNPLVVIQKIKNSTKRESGFQTNGGNCRSSGYVVPVLSLDEVLQRLGIPEIHFLKVDVEGAELAVLEGARQTLARSPQARILVEVHPGARAFSGCFSPGSNTPHLPTTPKPPCNIPPIGQLPIGEQSSDPSAEINPVANWLRNHGYRFQLRQQGARRFYITDRLS